MQFVDQPERKEKKGFFFKRKSSAKKDDKPSRSISRERIAVSTGISTQIPASDCLYGFYGAIDGPGKMHGMSPSKVRNVKSHGTNTVSGLLNQYKSTDGLQYYRDLAGNVKQGPIGYAPVCNCAPQSLRDLEARVEAGEESLYEHIEHRQRTLADRLEALDRRTTRQVHALGNWTRDRLQDERIAHVRHLDDRLAAERRITHDELDLHYNYLTNQMNSQTHLVRNAAHLSSFRPRSRSTAARPVPIYRSRSDESLSLSTRHEKSTSKTSPDGRADSQIVVVDVHHDSLDGVKSPFAQHSKADSGSNPDSGYSSKIFAGRQIPASQSSSINEVDNWKRPREVEMKPCIARTSIEINQTATEV